MASRQGRRSRLKAEQKILARTADARRLESLIALSRRAKWSVTRLGKIQHFWVLQISVGRVGAGGFGQNFTYM